MKDMEKREFADRIRAMDEEEQKLAVEIIPDDILLNEIKRRFEISKKMIVNARIALKMYVDE